MSVNICVILRRDIEMSNKKLAVKLQAKADRAAEKLSKAKAKGNLDKVAALAAEMQAYEVAAAVARGEK